MDKNIEFYNELVDVIHALTTFRIDTLEFTMSLENRLQAFYDALINDDMFILFSQTTVKAFSSTTVETHFLSCSLFEEQLSLKMLFNNMINDVKAKIWEALFLLYISLERDYGKPENNRVNILKEQIKRVRHQSKPAFKSDMLKKLIKTDNLNETTTNMLDDIIGSFQTGTGGNPFENVMGIANMISDKYSNNIENGEIELDKVLSDMMGGANISGLLGQQQAVDNTPVIINEQFNTSTVEVAPEKTQFDLLKLKPFAEMLIDMNKNNTTPDMASLTAMMSSENGMPDMEALMKTLGNNTDMEAMMKTLMQQNKTE